MRFPRKRVKNPGMNNPPINPDKLNRILRCYYHNESQKTITEITLTKEEYCSEIKKDFTRKYLRYLRGENGGYHFYESRGLEKSRNGKLINSISRY